MGRRIIQAFSLFSIAVFAFVIVWFVFRAINTRSSNIEGSQQQMDRLTQSLISSVLAGGGFDSERTSGTIAKAFAGDEDLRLLAVHDVEGRLDYLYAVSDTYLAPDTQLDRNRLLLPELDYNGVAEERIDTRMVFPDNSVRSLTTIHRVLDREDVFPIIREVLIALLAFLLITAVMIVLLPYIERARGTSGMGPTETPGRPQGTSDPGHRAEAVHPEQAGPTSTTGRGTAEPGASEPAHVERPASAESSTHTASPASTESPEPTAAEPTSEARLTETTPITRGLYSPNSDLGWEDYLEERLNTELKRAASFDQDLVLMLISVPWARRGTQEYAAIAEMLREYFAFRDLCFEYGETAFGAIVPNVELDYGMEKAKEFRDSLLPRAEADKTPTIGLSARNGRLMSGKRLIRETDRALNRAADEENGIVAFRVDPEKYRSYIASKS